MSTLSIAPVANDAAGTFQIVDPFHPCRGRPLLLVTVRQNWGENLIYYRDSDGRLDSVPVRWTDRVPPDSVVAISAGRFPFRLEELLELARLRRGACDQLSMIRKASSR